jgi:hypothetical protein
MGFWSRTFEGTMVSKVANNDTTRFMRLNFEFNSVYIVILATLSPSQLKKQS